MRRQTRHSPSSAAPTPVRRPTWAAEEIAEAVAPGLRVAHVVGDRDELVEGDAGRLEGADVLRQPVADALGLALEAAEEAVPDDQDAAVVAVEVDLVGAVVDAVVRGGVEGELEPGGHLLHPLGVDPELVD